MTSTALVSAPATEEEEQQQTGPRMGNPIRFVAKHLERKEMWHLLCVNQTWKADMIVSGPHKVDLINIEFDSSYSIQYCRKLMGSHGAFHIRSVSLSDHPTNEQFDQFIQRTGISMEQLEVYYGENIHDITALTNCHNLCNLLLHNCIYLTNIAPIANCTKLNTLKLRNCYRITDIKAIARLGLTFLTIASCDGITDIKAIARLAGLETLTIASCPGITDITPITGLPELNFLTIANCVGITDITPIAEIAMLGTLDEISLTGCVGITDITPLASCTNLLNLNIHRCTGITSIASLVSCTNLQRLCITKPEQHNLDSSMFDDDIIWERDEYDSEEEDVLDFLVRDEEPVIPVASEAEARMMYLSSISWLMQHRTSLAPRTVNTVRRRNIEFIEFA